MAGTHKGVLKIHAAVLLFAAGNALIKFGDAWSTPVLVLSRSVLAVVVSYILLNRMGAGLWTKSKLPLLVRGISGALALHLSTEAIPHLSLTTASMINQLSPVFTAVLFSIAFRKWVTSQQWLMICMALLGVWFMLDPGELQGGGAFWMYLGAVLSSSVGYIAINKAETTCSSLHFVFYTSFFSALLSLFWWWGMPSSAAQSVYAATDILILLSFSGVSLLATFLMTSAYQAGDVVKLNAISYLSMLYAIGLDFIFFNKLLSLKGLMGALLIILSVLFISGAKRHMSGIFSVVNYKVVMKRVGRLLLRF